LLTSRQYPRVISPFFISVPGAIKKDYWALRKSAGTKNSRRTRIILLGLFRGP
jgi:hypothetical protein